MNEERGSQILLIVYAAMLGWYAHAWWRAERKRITWDAAQQCREQMRFEASLTQPPPVTEASAGAT